MKTYILRSELQQEEDGRWSAVIPSLSGCATWGSTRQEALESVRKAAQAYIEILLEDGRALPSEVEGTVQVIPDAAVAVAYYSSISSLRPA